MKPQPIERRAALLLEMLIEYYDTLTSAIAAGDPERRLYEQRVGAKTAIAYMTGIYDIDVPDGATGVGGWLPTLKAVVAASKESIK